MRPTKWSVELSTWYYIYGLSVGLVMAILAASGISFWLYVLPVSLLSAIGLRMLVAWLEPNHHSEEDE